MLGACAALPHAYFDVVPYGSRYAGLGPFSIEVNCGDDVISAASYFANRVGCKFWLCRFTPCAKSVVLSAQTYRLQSAQRYLYIGHRTLGCRAPKNHVRYRKIAVAQALHTSRLVISINRCAGSKHPSGHMPLRAFESEKSKGPGHERHLSEKGVGVFL